MEFQTGGGCDLGVAGMEIYIEITAGQDFSLPFIAGFFLRRHIRAGLLRCAFYVRTALRRAVLGRVGKRPPTCSMPYIRARLRRLAAKPCKIRGLAMALRGWSWGKD